MPTTRRRFLAQSAGAAAATCLIPALARAAAKSEPSVQFPAAPRDRIAVAAYPFREFIVGWTDSDSKSPGLPPAQRIELKNFAAHVAEKFNIHKIEPWSPVFPSTERKYLDEFRTATEKARSAVVDIAVDVEACPYAADPAEREKSLASSKLWIDVGAALGSPSIRTHIHQAKDSKPDVGRASDTLLRVADYAQSKNVVVHFENDDPVSEDPFFIVQVLDKVNSPWLRALPDFGNSLAAHSNDADFAYRAIDAMFAHAYGICHVKDGELDEQGKPVHVDLARTFAILKKRGYKGYCSMEFDADGDPYKPTAELIEQTLRYLS
jgi:sugar phosphate isomerase/epimerase